jgi:hypothetical protein
MVGKTGLTQRQMKFGKGLARVVNGYENVKNKGYSLPYGVKEKMKR